MLSLCKPCILRFRSFSTNLYQRISTCFHRQTDRLSQGCDVDNNIKENRAGVGRGGGGAGESECDFADGRSESVRESVDWVKGNCRLGRCMGWDDIRLGWWPRRGSPWSGTASPSRIDRVLLSSLRYHVDPLLSLTYRPGSLLPQA